MSKNIKKGVLLLQLGTPDSPKTTDVRTYLREFLNDPRVIDFPLIARLLLVNLIIVPFRAPKSAKLYSEIWTDKGSPLLIYGENVRKTLQENLGDEYIVKLGMRYRNPSIKKALNELEKEKVSEIVLLPLFPQYASSSSGSALQQAHEIIASWNVIPNLYSISEYYSQPEYLDIWKTRSAEYSLNDYDHILFTYHGVPWRHIRKSGCSAACQKDNRPCPPINKENHVCYRAQCYATTEGIAQLLNLPKDKYSVSFQSRLGRDPWLMPYTDHSLEELAKNGKKKVLVYSPSFVADCLETIHEVGTEYEELFIEAGGEHLQLVESLNDHPKWIAFLEGKIRREH
jgi:ferrochelatase